MGNCGAKTKVTEDVEVVRELPSELTLKKKAELQAVLDADGIKREEGDVWYIVEAAWVQRWLAFVQGDDSVKKPGPIQNDNLLLHDKESNALVPKPLLRAARKEHMGHYRRVNPHVWKMWTGTYRGSGPAIFVETEPFEDSSNWQLDLNFSGASRGGGGEGGGGGIQEDGAGGGADEAWQRPAESLTIGEMEDDGIGQETAAKAAAFFDVALDSPRVSAAAAAGSYPTVGRSSASSGGGGGGSNGGGRGSAAGSGGGAVSSTRDTGSSGGGVDSAKSREPTAAEMWMYGSADGGSGAQQME